jgi:excisionase family DNA binding protein
MATATEAPDFLTTEEVATLLRTSPETVRFWRHVGKGPRSFKLGRRVLYAAEDVDAFIEVARQAQGIV